MNKKNTTNIIFIVLIAIIMTIGYFAFFKKPTQMIPVEPIVTQQEISISYTNNQYGFDFTLPLSWKGYSIIADKWIGQILQAEGETESQAQIEGPKILIRHPLWTKEIPRQDIPIMIFTLAGWDLIQQEKLSVGAAPVAPSEMGRNKNYVFALPARYNFAYPVGFEEVEKIIESQPLKAL